MPAPTRPGAPRASARGTARTPRSGVNRVGPPARPGEAASKGGGPKARPAVAPAPPKGSFAAVVSWRSLVFAGILGLAFALVWPSVRVYNEQQAQNAELRAERDAAQAEVDDLTAQLARWQDPAFVVAQARERLAYVFPGETPYRVVDPEIARPVAEGSVDAERGSDAGVDVPWFEKMWDSVEAAGAVPIAAAPATTPGTTPGTTPTTTPSDAPVTPGPGDAAPNVDLGG